MRKILYILPVFLSLYGFEILGPIHKDHTVTMSPGALGGLQSALILAECIPAWNAAIHYEYDYLADFQIYGSNSPPYNMFWHNYWGLKPLSRTYLRYYGDSLVVDSVCFNSNPKLHWSYGDPDSTTYHFKTVAKHEIGHMIGLEDEPDDTTVIMYPYIHKGEKRSIQEDDVRGVCCLYGDDLGNYVEGFSIIEPREDTVYRCSVPLQIGTCMGGGAINLKVSIELKLGDAVKVFNVNNVP